MEELFRARHGLIAVRTMATLSGEVYGRIATLTRFVPAEGLALVADLEDQFTRVRGVADGQKEFLHGVMEFYRTKTETKTTIAAERLVVIAVITLPITVLSSVYGMSIIVNDRTRLHAPCGGAGGDGGHLGDAAALAKRQGWW